MRTCDHRGARVYARRTLPNGTEHLCMQCIRCLSVVKAQEHGNRPYIRPDEIPADATIYAFIEPESLT